MITRPAAALTAAGLRRVLAVLCGTEIISWGVLYYALPVLAPGIAADTGWAVSTVIAAFSTGLVVAAVAGIPVGRLLDRWGPRPVMTAGSVLAGVGVVGIATARSPIAFFAAWSVAGVAMAGVLYQPAFAALTRWWGPRSVTALTGVTLLAGLASTVFAPLTATLAEHLSWRQTYLVLAVVLVVGTVPAHAFGLRGAWPDAGPGAAEQDPGAVSRSRAFVLLVAAVGLGSFAAFAVLVNQVPLFLERGMSTGAAAWALGLGGVGQVLGRFGYRWLSAATGAGTRTVLVLGAGAACTGALAAVPGPVPLLITITMLTGAARGIFTLLQATAISDRWGSAHYGRLGGILGAPAMLATALAPWAGSALADVLGGYPPVFALLAVVAVVAAALAAGSVPRTPTP
ncbi:MFS transporter [Pseudonocardia sp. GCM10023141]|uniref:MFS transporter n=1 Tax=Pseudonocardia sp. GCM10023141 TaxID=3252653 RepID=UPI003609EAF8